MENGNKDHESKEQEALSEFSGDIVSTEERSAESPEAEADTVLEESPPHIVVDHLQESEAMEEREPGNVAVSIKEKRPVNKWKIASIVLSATLITNLLMFVVDLGGKSDTITNLTKDNQELETKVEELSEKVATASPWFEMTETQQQEVVEQKKAKEAEAEAAAAAAKEEAEKVGYETGITYDQLARTPDDYLLEKVKFSGKVIQVVEDSDEITIRLAVNSDYDTVLICAYDPSIVTSRVLDDDKITIYGYSMGLYTYESTLGASITVPSVAIDKIDQ